MKTKNAVIQAVGRESIFAPEMNVVSKMKRTLHSWLSTKNETLSQMVEEEVTYRDTLHLGNFCIALTMLTTVGVLSTPLLCLSGGWFILSALPLLKKATQQR